MGSADPRRRSVMINLPTTLKDLTKELQKRGYPVKYVVLSLLHVSECAFAETCHVYSRIFIELGFSKRMMFPLFSEKFSFLSFIVHM